MGGLRWLARADVDDLAVVEDDRRADGTEHLLGETNEALIEHDLDERRRLGAESLNPPGAATEELVAGIGAGAGAVMGSE